MNIGMDVNLHNRFDIEVRDANTGELKQSATAYNIVLDALWTRLLNVNTFMGYIHFGTGTGTPTPERTSLFEYLGNKTAVLDEVSYKVTNMYRRIKITMQPSEYVGSVLTEVGVAYGTSSTNLCTHAMLTDAEGNPITITKTDLDVLIIYATVFFTVGELPPNVSLCWVNSVTGSVENPSYLYYLCGGGGSLDNKIRLGSGCNTSGQNQIAHGYVGHFLGEKTRTQTYSVADKKMIFNPVRFEISQGNGHIQEISLAGTVHISLPSPNYLQTHYNNIPIPGQDAAKVFFELPSRNIDITSIEVKVNGIIEQPEIIPLPYYDAYTFAYFSTYGTPYIPPVFFDRTTLIWPDESTTYIGKQTLDNYSLETGLPIYLSLWPGTRGKRIAYSKRGYYLETDTSNSSVYIRDEEFTTKQTLSIAQVSLSLLSLDDSIILAFAPNSTGMYTIYFDETTQLWAYKTTGLDNAIASYESNLAGFAISEAANTIFQAAGSATTSTFRLIHIDPETYDITEIIPEGATRTRRGAFSLDGKTLATFEVLNGVYTFEYIDGVWVRTDAIPTTETKYNSGWFIGNDCLVLSSGDTSADIWRKVGGVWEWVTTSTIFYSAPYNLLNAVNHSPDGQFCLPNYIAKTPYYHMLKMEMDKTAIRFDTPPLATDEITVSYDVKGIHKTENYVLDVGGYIQFGEG